VKNARRAKDLLLSKFRLDETRAMSLIDAVAQKSNEVLAQFKIRGERTLSYSQLLEKANEELSRLNISGETLIVEYREAKKRADQLAAELQAANLKLRAAAFRDDLTGLYNQRFFYEALAKELETANRNKTPVSMIMFDVDNFKGINDSYGHQTGDMALRAIGDYLRRTGRMTDIAARYGGDEFVVLLRNTYLEGARIRGKTICDELSLLPVVSNGVNIGITVSVGVAGYDQRVPMSKTHLIDLADKALYESKNNGRNRVSIQRGVA
jgi:diguanylate cyclase (GGDEF)-like protein